MLDHFTREKKKQSEYTQSNCRQQEDNIFLLARPNRINSIGSLRGVHSEHRGVTITSDFVYIYIF